MMPLAVLLACAVLTSPSDLDKSFEILDQLDSTRISVDLHDEPLEVVLDQLERKLGIPVRGNWSALDADAIDRDDRVSLRGDRSVAASVLAALTRELGDIYHRPVFEAHAGQLVLTTLEATGAMHETTVYDVRDLVDRTEVFEQARQRVVDLHEDGLEPEPDEADEPAPEAPDAAETPNDAETPDDPPADPENRGLFAMPDFDAGQMPLPTPGEDLLYLLIEHIDPDAWIDYGGSRARITERDGVFLVSATPTVHRRLQAALAELRRVYATGFTIDAAVIDVSRSFLTERRRRFDLRSAALGRTLLASDETTVLWRTSSLGALDRPLAVESTAGQGTVKLELAGRLDHEAGGMVLEIKAMLARDGMRSTVETTAVAPTRNGGIFLELPGATNDPERVRALLIIPETH